ncbi:MAG TPA: hypothetical protein VIT65_12975 [Microlunatus sp.]
MITREDDVDIHALRRQGWTITAIANHVGRDRKTVRNYLNGNREPGVRRRAEDPFGPFVEYVTARLVEDPHLWAVTLCDELEPLGFTASYQTLTRQIRARHRKGVVEKVNHTAAQRWWRTLADDMTIEKAQADCDRFATVRGDTRMRRSRSGDRKATVATVAAREPLRPVPPVPPVPYPVQLSETRVASRQALVSYCGNQYSVPPELASATVTVTQIVGAQILDISTSTGIVVARHRLEPDGAGVQVRDHGHVAALDATAMKAAAAARGPHRRKERIPPGQAARAAAATLHGDQPAPTSSSTVIDLAANERAARGRNPAMINNTRNPLPAARICHSPPRRRLAINYSAGIWPHSGRTPPPSSCPPSSTTPAPKAGR